MNVKKAQLIGTVLMLVTITCSFLFQSTPLSAALMVLYFLSALLAYGRAIPQMTQFGGSRISPKHIKIAGLVMLVLILGIIAFAIVLKTGALAITSPISKILMSLIISMIIIAFGIVAPRLPFNQKMGLRVPWTISDEQTWNIAHHVLGYTSWQIGLLCFAALSLSSRIEIWLLCILLAWLFVPCAISHFYIISKWRKEDAAKRAKRRLAEQNSK